MNFEELWKQVKGFSDIAKQFIPNALSDETKKKLENYSSEEIASIINNAVEEINRGSIETVDSLVRKQLV